MKYLVCLAAFSLTLAGQTCASLMSTQAQSFSGPSFGPRGASQIVTLTPGAGNPWSITNGGSFSLLADAGGNHSGTGDPITGQVTLYNVVAGTGYQFGPGSSTDTLTIQFGAPNNISCNLVNSWTRTTRLGPGPFTNNAGVPDNMLAGSSSAGAWVVSNDRVPFSQDGSLPGGSYLLAAQGSTYTSAQWGTQILTLTPPGYYTAYEILHAMNADDSLVLAVGPAGSSHVFTFPGSVDHPITFSPPLAVSTDMCRWDPLIRNVCYYFSGNTIQKATINTSAWTVSSTTAYTFSCSGGSCPPALTNGGTDDLNPIGWLSFYSNMDHSGSTAHPQICAIDITATATEHCADLSVNYVPAVSGGINYTMLSQGFSSATNKLYVWTNVGSQPPAYGPRYSYTSGAGGGLVFEGMFSIAPEAEEHSGHVAPYTTMTCDSAAQTANICSYTGAHAHSAQDVAGHQYWVTTQNSGQEPFHPNTTIVNLDSANAVQTLPSQLGGGSNFFLPIQGSPINQNIGCRNDWCAVTVKMGPNQLGVVSCLITNATGTGTVTLTTSCSNGMPLSTGGTAAYVASVAGCAGINGAYAGANVTVSGTTVTLAGATCAGYTANTGVIYANTYPTETYSYAQEVVLLHILNGVAIETRRLGRFLAIPFTDNRTQEDYWENGMCNISSDIQWVICNSNGGIADARRVVVLKTGLPIISDQFAGTNVLAGGNVVQ